MSPVTLYKKQKQILEFISQYIQSEGHSPTLQGIADAMGLSSLATVHEHLKALESKGVIKRYDGTVRGIEILDDRYETEMNSITLPLVGYIAAGEPIEAIENSMERISVAADMVNKARRCYVLQVKGDSMIEEKIFDGDFVVIQQQETAKAGEIVVALIDNEFATLKTIYFEDNGLIRLQPANPKMDPIYVEADRLTIQGKVTGVIRRYA
jgi:repressor LexA